MDGAHLKQENAGRLQQMSEDMKLHIAQLKAELSSTDTTHHETGEEIKTTENKEISSPVCETTKFSEDGTALLSPSKDKFATEPVNEVYGNLLKKDTVESLKSFMSEDLTTSKYCLKSSEDCNQSGQAGDSVTTDITTKSIAGLENWTPVNHSLQEAVTPLTHDMNKSNSTNANLSKTFQVDDEGNIKGGDAEQPLGLSDLPISTDDILPVNSSQNGDAKMAMNQTNKIGNKSIRSKPSRSKKELSGARKRRDCRSKPHKRDSDSSTATTSLSSPRSMTEPAENPNDVKYLQMTNKMSRHAKKTSASTTSLKPKMKSSSLPTTARGLKADGEKIAPSSLDDGYKTKYEQLEAQLAHLQLQCEQLAEENIKMKREERSKAQEKISTLKRNNAELANIARRLEEKARSLQDQNVNKTQEIAAVSRDLQQQKRAHQRHRARWEAEQGRTLAECNDQLTSSRAQIDDLKKALRQARREKIVSKVDMNSGEDVGIIQQNSKEMLRLQKLAAAASSKVVVRSLSTPVTARQKILEETNRKLRRQVTELERSLQEVEGRTSESLELKEKLSASHATNEALSAELDSQKNSLSTLKSQLEEAKVESSDVSIQLNELRHNYSQLQSDYSTVHDQLSVAIKERDHAVNKCLADNGKIIEMESVIKALKAEEATHRAMQNHHEEAAESHRQEMDTLVHSHEKIVTEYQDALRELQSKVSELEQQCHEHDETNKNMKKQLTMLVEWSKHNPSSPDNSSNNNNNIAGITLDSLHHPIRTQPLPRKSPHSLHSEGSRSASCGNSVGGFHSDNDIVRKTHKAMESNVADALDDVIPIQNKMAVVEEKKSISGLKLYIAKYTYDPYEGPNDHPELELPLIAGDYLYIRGIMDEDGFYEGELMSGRRGLVPSNFIEPLHDDATPSRDVIPPHEGALHRRSVSPNHMSSAAREGSLRSTPIARSLDSELSHSRCSDASSSWDNSIASYDHTMPPSDEKRKKSAGILPFPRKLRIDKKLSHTFIIGWVAPQLDGDDLVEQYHILVDGQLSTVVDGDKYKAVVENIYDDAKLYYISVCALTRRGRSDPGHCVLAHGPPEALAFINGLNVEFVSSESARLSWKTLNSNHTYSILIGEVSEDQHQTEPLGHYQRQILVPSPMYHHTINGLQPNSLYEVIVKSRSSTTKSEPSSNPLRFRTTLVGPPEAPLGVELEETTDLITISWIPVTLEERGKSNGVAALGYKVHINQATLATIEPATRDACQISRRQFTACVRNVIEDDLSFKHRSFGFSNGLPVISVTVRTIAEGGQSSDRSEPFLLPKQFVVNLMKSSSDVLDLEDIKQPIFRVGSSTVDANLSSVDVNKLERVLSSNAHIGIRADDASPSNVPLIEITRESSSDEEENNPENIFLQSNGRSPSQRSLKSRRSEANPSDARRRIEFDQSSGELVASRNVRSKSWNHPNRSPRTELDHHARSLSPNCPECQDIHSDEDSSASSGGHTSTSTSGSLGRRPRSRSHSRNRNHHAWTRVESRPSRQDGPVLSMDETTNEIISVHQQRHPTGRYGGASPHQRRARGSRNSGRDSFSEVDSQVDSFDDSRVSLYVALYDYYPNIMSPNCECFDDELTFTEGQLLKIYGKKDGDGFFVGEDRQGKRGLVPSNMISYIEVDDYSMLQDLFEQGHLPSSSPNPAITHHRDAPLQQPEDHMVEPVSDDKLRPIPYRALYDYDPREASPNIDAEIELNFCRGDVIKIFGSIDEDGFLRGELQGQYGLVPSNFVERVVGETPQEPNKAPVEKATATTMTEASVIRVKSSTDPNSITSTSSTTSSHKSDSGKKKGIFSKGKKLLKKLGGNEARVKR